MKISKIIFSELLLFMLVFNSGAFNGPAVPVVPSSTITKSYYITGREVVGVGTTHFYYVVCLETETDADGVSSTRRYSPSPSECQWTVPSGFSASYVQWLACIQLTAPSSPSSSTTLQVNVNGIASAPKQITVTTSALPPITVEITPSGDTIDGYNSGQFSVTVQPAGLTVDSYTWSWQAPTGAGNNPQVAFGTGNQQNTIVNNAHWFASPDNRLKSVTGWDCEYTINCTVVINGVQYVDSTPPTWRVYLPDPPAETAVPRIDGMVSIGQFVSTGEWYVCGMGTLVRTAPVVYPHIPSTSQFYNKVVTIHEARHVEQLTTGVSGTTVHTLWDPTVLYNVSLSTMTSTVSEADLRNQVLTAILDYNDFDNIQLNAQRQMLEHDAFTQSNAVPPDYLEFDVPMP